MLTQKTKVWGQKDQEEVTDLHHSVDRALDFLKMRERAVALIRGDELRAKVPQKARKKVWKRRSHQERDGKPTKLLAKVLGNSHANNLCRKCLVRRNLGRERKTCLQRSWLHTGTGQLE